MTMIDRERLHQVLEKEITVFADEHPQCYALYQRAKNCLLDGVPMNWMVRWAGGFPLFVTEAKGACFTCADGKHFLDFCLGDTGAMVGHSPDEPMRRIAEQLGKGITFMLPTEDAIWVSEELQRRFNLKYWQMTLTATDANRFVLRLARHITKRPYVLVFDYCYHGSVDETFITINDGIPGPRPGAIGPQVNPVITTRVVPWNNIPALEQALAPGDVACVLAEPVMTNIGIIHPDEGYHQALRDLTRKYGTLLVIDETHTMCAGPGGYTGEAGLEPDILTVGKTIGSGIPAAVYGLSEEVGEDGFGVDQGGRVGRGRHRRHAGRQCPLAGGHARHAGDLPEQGGLRPHHPAGRALHRRRDEGDQGVRPALGDQPAGLPGGVLVLREPAAQRRRRRGRGGWGAGPLHAPVRPQPRHLDDAVPQHGPHRPGRHRGGYRPPHGRLPRGGGSAGGVNIFPVIARDPALRAGSLAITSTPSLLHGGPDGLDDEIDEHEGE